MKKHLLIAFLTVCFFANSGRAQNAPAITASLQTLGLGVYDEGILIKQGEKYVPLRVYADVMPDEVVPYSGDLVLPLLHKVQDANAKEATYVTIGEVQFPQPTPNQTNEFVILFTPGAGGKLSATVIRNDKVNFPEDSVRVINTLPAPAGVMVEKTVNVVKPGESKIFSVAEPSGQTEIHIAISSNENKWVEVCNNVFPLSHSYRRTIFIMDRTPANAQNRRRPLITMLTLAEPTVKKPKAPVEP
ncbi:MAG: hypothetical protein ACAH89_07440 [Rariglobus sp.]